jgi:hypothetical protein
LLQSKEGLQNSLDILHDFCYTWKLKVNTDKSKIMVFNSNGKTYLNQFTYNNVDLETVANYYLGNFEVPLYFETIKQYHQYIH